MKVEYEANDCGGILISFVPETAAERVMLEVLNNSKDEYTCTLWKKPNAPRSEMSVEIQITKKGKR